MAIVQECEAVGEGELKSWEWGPLDLLELGVFVRRPFRGGSMFRLSRLAVRCSHVCQVCGSSCAVTAAFFDLGCGLFACDEGVGRDGRSEE